MSNGLKFDSGKPRYDLVPFSAMDEVARVLTVGAEKYGDDNWREVDEAHRRYFAAAMRHMSEYQQGRVMDAETNLHALAHAACSLLFILAIDIEAASKAKHTAGRTNSKGKA